MENRKKSYWKGVEQLMNRPDFVQSNEKEFAEHLPIKDAYGDNSEGLSTNRRDFLKLMGFSVAAVSLAACEAPIKKAVPYLNKPEEVDPGIPNYYASTYTAGSDYCAVLVKTREGRPIFIEGNDFSSFSKGVVNARAQASIMGLYDVEKDTDPTKGGQKATWEVVDQEIKNALSSVGGTIYVVSNTIISPSTHEVLGAFKTKYPNTKVVTYDQESLYGMTEANRAMFGKAAVPAYSFEKAQVIVSVAADFLGNWVSAVNIAPAYAQGRKVGKDKKEMSRHYQFEAMLSMTGANADTRTPIRASQEGLVVAKIFNKIASATGNATISTPDVAVDVDKAVADLLAAKGKSLVVAGANHAGVQTLVNGINQMLENYGQTLDMSMPVFLKQGNDKAMSEFVASLGGSDAVIFYNCNPVYDHPAGAKLAEKIKGAKLSVATADRLNETASLCAYNCPDSHFLESWGDAEPKKGIYSLAQPAIRTIFNTRQAQDSFMKWMGAEGTYKDFVQKFWEEKLMAMQTTETSATKFWQRSLHDGVFEPGTTSLLEKALGMAEGVAGVADFAAAGSQVASAYKASNTETELVIYSSSVMGWGDQGNNPYLHETPEPISKICWGNYIAISMAKAKELGVEPFETRTKMGKITVGSASFELPLVPQPGLESNTVAVALGYGRTKGGKVAAEAKGENMFSVLGIVDGFVTGTISSGVGVAATGATTHIAQTQTHGTIMGRETIIQETTLASYQKDALAGAYRPMIATGSGPERPNDLSLWDVNSDRYGEEHLREGEKSEKEKSSEGGVLWNDRMGLKADQFVYPQHHWGLAIDLNSCTGCSACVVACHTENNVPIVGKQEVINRREMHWLRIDRYYSSDGEAGNYDDLEKAAENPQIVFQPMMCQHCNNAPCETVCPVAATTHSSEGLNQMTYNRCVGTKYCANNCPYKVRRFNWFKYNNNDEFNYHMNDKLGKMVLNPDVTVRSRGVMEKCSMCVQRIQGGKLQAKREGRKMQDGDASVACAKACPSNAIVFGDLNDESSQIRMLMNHEIDARAYNVLEEINVRPNVWYLRKVRNTEEQNA